MGRLEITREAGYINFFRAYNLFIDGEAKGAIRVRESVSLDLSPGEHTLEARIDWCRSNLLQINIHQFQTRAVVVKVGNPLLIFTPIPGFIELLLRPD